MKSFKETWEELKASSMEISETADIIDYRKSTKESAKAWFAWKKAPKPVTIVARSVNDFVAGYNAGYAQGHEDGHAEGHNQGVEIGRTGDDYDGQ